MNIPEMLQARHALMQEAEGLTAAAVSEDRAMSSGESRRFDLVMEQAREFSRRIEEEKARSSATGKMLGQ